MKTSGGEAPDLRILSAGITDGALQWEDLRGGFRVDIPSWDLAVEGRIARAPRHSPAAGIDRHLGPFDSIDLS